MGEYTTTQTKKRARAAPKPRRKNREWNVTTMRKILKLYKAAPWGKKGAILKQFKLNYSHIAHWKEWLDR